MILALYPSMRVQAVKQTNCMEMNSRRVRVEMSEKQTAVAYKRPEYLVIVFRTKERLSFSARPKWA